MHIYLLTFYKLSYHFVHIYLPTFYKFSYHFVDMYICQLLSGFLTFWCTCICRPLHRYTRTYNRIRRPTSDPACTALPCIHTPGRPGGLGSFQVAGSGSHLGEKHAKDLFMCRLRSIATHRDHFVRRPSVCPICPHFSVTLSKAMFCRRHMHSSECCHYF